MTEPRSRLSEPNVFSIRPPSAEAPTKYLLMLYKAGGPFGSGGQPTVFGIDELRALSLAADSMVAWQGLVGETVLCQFSANSSYLLVDRSLIDTMSPLEAYAAQKLEDEEMEKLQASAEKSKDSKPLQAEPGALDGVPTGQYL